MLGDDTDESVEEWTATAFEIFSHSMRCVKEMH